jgi:hypothetical protein
MAYLDFRAAELSGSIASVLLPATATAREPEAHTFTALEWLVIALAERDTMASLRSPGRLAVAMGRLFGSSETSRLADPRLEALRRLAVTAWHRGFDVPQSELAAFHDAGFSIIQAEMLLQSVLSRRATRTRRRSVTAFRKAA